MLKSERPDVATEYAVTVPIYGTAVIYVEATSEAEAIEKAVSGQGWSDSEVSEWEVSTRCGNICHRTIHDRITVEVNE